MTDQPSRRARRRQAAATPIIARADTIVDGSGVLVADGGWSDDGGFNPWPEGGLDVTGGLQVGGGGQVLDGWPASCQLDTAGGADGGVICSAAGGFATGDGTIDDEPEPVGASAEVGVSGGTRGTRLVGFRI